ncbi:protocadherin alpha-13-like [Passer montanus]|uniref:protocadherin alpha-13-like n=1 Tax=Passer montanus TaxID=9160 RepID=UPI00196030C5|nr:protocadherin alpha-13-like [Passer montanus]
METDFEEVKVFDFRMEARDKGTPPLSGHCKLVLEVLDVNDNAPEVWVTSLSVPVAEDASVGTVVALLSVSDRDSGENGRVRCWVWPASPFGLPQLFLGIDIGANAQLSYTLSPNDYFRIEEESSNSRTKSLFLVLTKSLDRETIPVHRLVLTASDGGRPSLTGTMELLISVLDVNDNAPQFNQSVYNVVLSENALEGTLVAQVNATDSDTGIYGEIIYEIDTTVPPSAGDLFSIHANSGEIRLTGALDFETVTFYELHIKGMDKGMPPLSGHCKVVLEVLDVNDNAPEVWVTSLSVPVAEDASVGTVVALLSVSDRDSGENGRVRCWVWPASPFGLEATFAGSYSLVLREALDRERVSEYEVEVRAEDGGAPALRASRGLRVPVSDVNDNAPAFAQAVYTVLARENNAAGAELARLWARDPDEAGNGRVSYSLWEGGVGGGGGAAGSSSSWSGGGWRPASSYVSVDAESGRLWALQPLDYEELQVLQFEVRAVDAGEPPLSGNATVQLFVLDENDNAPALLPAAGSAPEAGAVAAETAAAGVGAGSGSGTLWAWAAWGAPAGQVVAKIRAVDADSGYNAWLRYELWEPRGKGPFRVGLYSGEVSTARVLDEADGPRQRLLIVVRDHGEPARSATATLSVSLLEAAEAALAAGSSSSASPSRSAVGVELGPGAASAATNVWLVVAICAVSSLFLLAVVLYGASRWAPRAAVLSGPGPTTLVCASEVGSWSYSQRHSRSLCVADGAAKSDLMVFSPNFPPPPPPPPGPAPKDTQPEPSALLDTVSAPSFVPFSVPFLRPL